MMGMGSGTSGNRSAPDPRMEAVRKVQAHLSTFELPGQIRCSYAGATKQAGMLETHPVTDDNEFNVDVELRVVGRSGPVYARVPVPVRQGALLRPSVIFIDGQARMIAQSVFDDLRTMLTVDMSKQGQVQSKTAQIRGLSRGDLTWLYQQQKDPNSPAPEPAPSLPPKKVNVRVPPHKDNLTPWTDIIPEQFDAHSIFEAGGLQWQVTQVHPAESGNCYVLHAQSIDPGHPDLKRLDEFIAGDILWTVDDVRPWRRKLGNNLYGLIAYNLPTHKPKTATYSVDMSKQSGQAVRMSNKTAQSESEKPDDDGRATNKHMQSRGYEDWGKPREWPQPRGTKPPPAANAQPEVKKKPTKKPKKP